MVLELNQMSQKDFKEQNFKGLEKANKLQTEILGYLVHSTPIRVKMIWSSQTFYQRSVWNYSNQLKIKSNIFKMLILMYFIDTKTKSYKFSKIIPNCYKMVEVLQKNIYSVKVPDKNSNLEFTYYKIKGQIRVKHNMTDCSQFLINCC